MMGVTITPAMRALIRASWEGRDQRFNHGYGVELYGSGPWAVARRLEALELGRIEGDPSSYAALPGMFFANRDAAIEAEMFDDSEELGEVDE